MSTKTWRIEEFSGIDQSRDGALANEGTSPYACNMDTADGNLAVAKGFVKHIAAPIPGGGPVRRIALMPLMSTMVYAAIAADSEERMNLYAYDPGSKTWKSIYRYPATVTGRYWDFLQCNIGNYDYMLIACGEHQMLKWDGVNAEAKLFGTGETAYESTVAAYDAASKTVTLQAAFDADIAGMMKRKGLILNGTTQKVESASSANKTAVLKDAPSTAPAAGNSARVRGGVSTAKVNYLAMHYSRLFAAGDPEHPSRLYYSQVSGDGRTIEDWSADEASPNSGGGLIEVGDSVGDPIMGLISLSTQLLIIKRYSIYRLLGDRPSNYTVERVDAQVERMTHTAVARHADIAYYMTPSGLYYFNNVTVQPMPDARNLRAFMQNCLVSQCKACEARGKLYFTCYKGSAPDSREYDDHIIVYDTYRRTYMLRNGFQVADITSLDGIVYMVNEKRILYRFEEGPDYDGEPIHAVWNTPCTDWQARSVDKRVDEVYLRGTAGAEDAAPKDGSPLLFYTLHGGREQLFRTRMRAQPEAMLEIRPQGDWARTFQFRIENEEGSRFTLHGGLETYIMARDRPR